MSVVLPINVNDSFEISIGGLWFGGWTSATASRSVSQMSGTFSLTLIDPMMLLFGSPFWTQFSPLAQPGVDCEIWIGGQKFLTGKIDTRNASKSAESHQVTVSGRSKTRDFVDSQHTGKRQYVKQKPSQIVKDVAKPHGVKVLTRGIEEKTIKQYKNFVGDYDYDIAIDVGLSQGITYTDDKDGNLVMRGKDKGPAAGALVQGVNLLTWDVNKSDQDKGSKYQAKGQTYPDGKARGKVANQPHFEVEDGSTLGTRTFIVVTEGDVDKKDVEKRGYHEAARRAGHSLKVSCTLYGYKGESGQLWEPDTMAPVYIPDEGVAEPLLLESVTFTKSESGSITSLQLTRKEAYEAKPSTGKKQGAKGSVAKGAGGPGKIILGPSAPSLPAPAS